MKHQHMMSYQIILCAELNNVAVSLIENGQPDFAIDSFKQIVGMLKSSAEGSLSINEMCPSCIESSDISNGNILTIIQQDPLIKLAQSRLQGTQTIDSSKIHQNAAIPSYFNLKPPKRIKVANFLDDICANNEITLSMMLDIISVTALFNLGVTHHIKASFYQQQYCFSVGTPKSMRSLTLDLYNIAWSMLIQIESDSVQENSWYEELSILVLSNLCFFYREQGQYDIARNCLTQIGKMIIQTKYTINIDGHIEINGSSLAAAA